MKSFSVFMITEGCVAPRMVLSSSRAAVVGIRTTKIQRIVLTKIAKTRASKDAAGGCENTTEKRPGRG